jgi:spermidine synthase
MNHDGVVVTQMGPAGIINYLELFTAVSNTLNQVFSTVVPYVASIQSFGEPWGYGFASKSLSPLELNAEEVNQRLLERGVRNLRFYDGETHTGLFSLPLFLRKALVSETRVNSLQSPLVIF